VAALPPPADLLADLLAHPLFQVALPWQDQAESEPIKTQCQDAQQQTDGKKYHRDAQDDGDDKEERCNQPQQQGTEPTKGSHRDVNPVEVRTGSLSSSPFSPVLHADRLPPSSGTANAASPSPTETVA
jgi:hypothetical protein